MNIAILGTGVVGRTIGSRLVELGHSVSMGSRSPDNERAAEWARNAGSGASHGTFADAAAFGEIVFNCTNGAASMDALRQAGERNLAGKLLIDVSNPLDFSGGVPKLFVCNTESLAERIQAAFPETRVVKSLNTMNCHIMVHPERVPGDHNAFVSGDDAAARERVVALLADEFGWRRENVIDLGDLSSARGAEMLLPLWIRLWGVFQGPDFNFEVRRATAPAA